jgi:hypothetical protein
MATQTKNTNATANKIVGGQVVKINELKDGKGVYITTVASIKNRETGEYEKKYADTTFRGKAAEALKKVNPKPGSYVSLVATKNEKQPEKGNTRYTGVSFVSRAGKTAYGDKALLQGRVLSVKEGSYKTGKKEGQAYVRITIAGGKDTVRTVTFDNPAYEAEAVEAGKLSPFIDRLKAAIAYSKYEVDENGKAVPVTGAPILSIVTSAKEGQPFEEGSSSESFFGNSFKVLGFVKVKKAEEVVAENTEGTEVEETVEVDTEEFVPVDDSLEEFPWEV